VQHEAALTVVHRVRGRHAVISLSGELDLDGTAAVMAAVDVVAGGRVKVVEIDARDLDFVDSAGLQTLLKARASVLRSGRTFRMSGVSGAVKRVVNLAGIGDVLLTDESSA